MMSRGWTVWLLVVLGSAPVLAQEAGRDLYMQRCWWCHGEQGRGDGPSAIGMFPRPRDLVLADYKIRSTGHTQLPTDADLLDVISRGLPQTPMPGWSGVLSREEIEQLVSYIKSLSPRFQSEERQPLPVPSGSGSVERGALIYREARCFMCHGDAGRGDGGITAALNFEWGQPQWARDFTRGWTFKGAHEVRDIYLRITGGLNGTPMGPYQELLSDEQRWDLAHYVASLDEEPDEASDDFVVLAGHIDGEIPDTVDSPEWQQARPIVVPLAAQVVLDPPDRWWRATTGSARVRALWNGRSIAFLLEWNDPTGPEHVIPDSVSMQFALVDGGKPYFLGGGADDPVRVWHWQSGDRGEEWTARGVGRIDSRPVDLQLSSAREQGRWQVILRGGLGPEPAFGPATFVPVVFSVGDGANGELGHQTAISTWLYVALEPPRSFRPWLSALVWLLGAVIVELWALSRLRS